ncbi:MAG: NADH-quinone oxidoreductase subunit NuoK [Limnochordales bacterium]|nr:NADH-quinone oxidoreductase subunit NuoK [Limnochordales bacterium]
MIPLGYFLGFGVLLFALGLYGVLTQRSAIRMVMAIELMLNAANINFLAFTRYLYPDDPRGAIWAIFVMTVAAAEVAVGLAVILVLSRRRQTIDVDAAEEMKH